MSVISDDSYGDGAGDGAAGGSHPEALRGAFDLMSHFMAQMQNAVRTVDVKMEKTDEAVRAVAESMRDQNERLRGLEMRLKTVEGRMSRRDSSRSSSGRRGRSGRFSLDAAVQTSLSSPVGAEGVDRNHSFIVAPPPFPPSDSPPTPASFRVGPPAASAASAASVLSVTSVSSAPCSSLAALRSCLSPFACRSVACAAVALPSPEMDPKLVRSLTELSRNADSTKELRRRLGQDPSGTSITSSSSAPHQKTRSPVEGRSVSCPIPGCSAAKSRSDTEIRSKMKPMVATSSSSCAIRKSSSSCTIRKRRNRSPVSPVSFACRSISCVGPWTGGPSRGARGKNKLRKGIPRHFSPCRSSSFHSTSDARSMSPPRVPSHIICRPMSSRSSLRLKRPSTSICRSVLRAALQKKKPLEKRRPFTAHISSSSSGASIKNLMRYSFPRVSPSYRRSYLARSFSGVACTQTAADRDALGMKLLKAAQDDRKKDVVQLLREGADVNFCNMSRWTALHRATKNSHAEMISLLLEKGADVNATTSYGFTALHMAAYNDRSGRCATILINAGSVVDMWNQFGQTPLHYAADCGNEAAVKVLLASGASKYVKNKDGKTPLDVATNEKICKILRWHDRSKRCRNSRQTARRLNKKRRQASRRARSSLSR